MTLSQSPEERVGKSVLAHVGDQLLVNLEGGEVGRGSNGILGEGLNDGGLVAGGVDELVVKDLDARVLALELDDLVGDGLGIGEGGDALANTGEAQDDILVVGAAQLGAGLLADDDEVGLAVGEAAANPSRQTRVHTTAKTLVGTADDVQRLLVLGLEGLGLSGVVDLVGSSTVLLGVVHGSLGAGQLGGGDDLHGLGDLLDVANGLETTLDLTQGGVGGRIVGSAAGAK